MQRAGGCTRARSRSENLKRRGDPGAFQGSSLLPHYRVTSFQEPERQTAFSILSWWTDRSIHAGAQVNDASLCCRREASHVTGRRALWPWITKSSGSYILLIETNEKLQLKTPPLFLWLFFFCMESWAGGDCTQYSNPQKTLMLGQICWKVWSEWKWPRGCIYGNCLNCDFTHYSVKC